MSMTIKNILTAALSWYKVCLFYGVSTLQQVQTMVMVKSIPSSIHPKPGVKLHPHETEWLYPT
jgi:hypothetical protein